MRRSVVQYCQTGRKDESETMKLMFASDLHGSAVYVAQLLERMREEEPERLILLGDLLYHGPRNDLPAGYDTKQVAAMLNGIGDRLLCVRGNCEAEVDQMVLKFPCMADHNILVDPTAEGGPLTLFLTHGHIYGPGCHNRVDAWPALPERSALVYGHTHIKVSEKNLEHNAWVFNPGSVGIPKDGTASLGVYEGGRFEHRLL